MIKVKKDNVEYQAKQISGYSNYYITENGDVYSTHYNRFLEISERTEYPKVYLTDDNKKRRTLLVHKLVALTYLPNPNNLAQINHIDGDKYNPKLSNLEWISASDNIKHSIDSGLRKITGTPVIQSRKDGMFVARYETLKEAAKSVGIRDPKQISEACRGIRKDYKGYIWQFETEEEIIANLPDGCVEIPDFSNYYAHRDGSIYSIKSNTIKKLKAVRHGSDYLRVHLGKTNKYVHQLIAITFVSKPESKEKLYVNHIDGNKANPCADNLEWVTHTQNVQHAHNSGLNSTSTPIFEYTPGCKLVIPYDSVAEAAIRKCPRQEGENNEQYKKRCAAIAESIRAVCYKKENCKSCLGSLWRFQSDPLDDNEITELLQMQPITIGTPVKQYSLKGEFIAEFESMSAAARHFDISMKSIQQSCDGKSTCKGFVWRRSSDPAPGITKTCNRKVIQMDLDGNEINRFDSLEEAAKANGMSSASKITSVCKGNRASAGNGIDRWKWRYDE